MLAKRTYSKKSNYFLFCRPHDRQDVLANQLLQYPDYNCQNPVKYILMNSVGGRIMNATNHTTVNAR